jgi:mono/diheme cytochrome c family protein
MKRIILWTAGAALLLAAVLWWVTSPERLSEADLPQHTANVENGRLMFYAGGCASCHATPMQDDKLLLGGGEVLETPFGRFHVPNISPHPEAGIGDWSTLNFVNAMVNGVSPEGVHLYPAFPYTSYRRMRRTDIIDLKAFLDTLPPVESPAIDHELAFPYNVRRGLAFWKSRYLRAEEFTPDPMLTEQENRGAYLVRGPGHCGECHTPRDAWGGMDNARYLSGAVNPTGEGGIPNITPHADGIGDWSLRDITYLLETGNNPEFDHVGGHMARVVLNTEQLPAADREAMAAYLKKVPPLPDDPNLFAAPAEPEAEAPAQ